MGETHSVGSITTVPIPRVRGLTPDAFHAEFDRPQRPVIITGGATSWACAAWSFDSLERDHGETPISLMRSKSYVTTDREDSTLAAYVRLIREGTAGTRYLNQFSLRKLAALDAQVPTTFVPASRTYIERNLWVGPAGTTVGLHKDNHTPLDHINNLFAQLVGKKHVLLAGPAEDAHLVSRAKNATGHWHSDIDPRAPDFERFPQLRGAVFLEGVVEPGDLLFVAGDYWHSFVALTPSISVSSWWRVHRLTELVIAKMSGVVVSDEIGDADVMEFGGVERLRAALHTPLIPPPARAALVSLLSPPVKRTLAALGEIV